MLRKVTTSLLLMLLIAAGLRSAQAQEVVQSSDIDGDVVWTPDNEYVLDGYVFVESGESLTIEAGTVIRGKEEPTTGDPISALIVAQDAKIYAEGAADKPIIFTAEGDDVSDPNDMAADDRGLWGGVVLLGNAPTNEPTTPHIEGIPESEATSYGGDDPEDDSGIFRYVSIRHGGQALAPGNEINGLTFGGVGSRTTIEYVEVYNNQDDCFEWFGGTAQTRFLVGAFCGDDAFDYDQGFSGKGQFWFTIQPAEVGQGNRAGEHDGGDTEKTAQPYSTPQLYNVTYLGGGVENGDPENQAFAIRDNGGGHYSNSIFSDFGGNGLNIADEGDEDSRERLANGQLTFENNLWYGFGPGNTWSDIAGEQWGVDYLSNSANNNWAEDPMLRGVSRTDNAQLDPRPQSGSPALEMSRVKDVPTHTFYSQTNYLGAFGHSNWTTGWSFVAEGGFVETGIEEVVRELPTSVDLRQNYPNPFNPSTNIRFELDKTQQVRLTVYNALGREVKVLVNSTMPAGTHMTTFRASDLPSGVYYYRLEAGTQRMTRKMLLLK